MTTLTSGLIAVSVLGGVDLPLADAVEVVEDLALEVRRVDDVHVDDADRADASGGEVEGGGGPETAGAEQEDLGVEQLQLPLDVDLGQHAAGSGCAGRG